MKGFESVEAILDFAIGEERQAQAFYREMAGKARNEAMRELFEDFALEEQGHEEKLKSIQRGERVLMPAQKVKTLRIAEYIVDIEPKDDMSYQDALIVAMQKEKAAFRLYQELAKATEEPELRRVLEGLAMEEAKHKLRFEVEYDTLME